MEEAQGVVVDAEADASFRFINGLGCDGSGKVSPPNSGISAALICNVSNKMHISDTYSAKRTREHACASARSGSVRTLMTGSARLSSALKASDVFAASIMDVHGQAA